MCGPPDSNSAQSAVDRRGIRWDAIAAIIASLIGFLALLVGGYTAYVQRYTADIQAEQVRAQVWPYLLMGKSNAQGHYELVAINKGVGPAIVRSVQVLVAGRPVKNWEELDRLLGFKREGIVVTSTLNGLVLAPGEKIRWIVFHDASGINSFVEDWNRLHVEARVCYSSTLGESWIATYQMGPLVSPQQVARCSVPISAQFFD